MAETFDSNLVAPTTPIQWTSEKLNSFQKCKDELINATLLAHPSDKSKICLMVDASDYAIGGVVHQFKDGCWQPLAFFSQKLNSTQRNYSTYDRELYSIYASIKHFRNLLEARDFIIFTDHKPIIFAFHQKNEKASPRQLRQLDFIGQFSTDIQHISGKDNIVADALSRIDTITLSSSVNYSLLAKEQDSDKELLKLKFEKTGLKLVKIEHHDVLVTCDLSTDIPRPYVPSSFRKIIFDQIHRLCHAGIKATTTLVKRAFIWPNMSKDIKNWCRSCIPCQKTKVHRHNKSPFEQIMVPNERFEHVHIDIVGPLPSSEGFTYCLTCIDRFSRWPEAIPISDIKAETVAKAFFLHWISRFGIPIRLTTDQGTQFESELFTELNKFLGTRKLHTTPYHPQANGLVERWHRTFKNAIKCNATNRWMEVLPTILLGLRSIILENLNASPAELVYGQNLRLPFHFFHTSKSNIKSDPHTFVERLKSIMNKLQPRQASNHDKQQIFIAKDMDICTHVFVRHDGVKTSLQPNYDGPFEVVSKAAKFFCVKIKGKEKQISIDRLKPMFTLENISVGKSSSFKTVSFL